MNELNSNDYAKYGNISSEEIISIFTNKDSKVAASVLETVKNIMSAGEDASILLVDQPEYRLMLNIQVKGGVTPAERHGRWHDLSFYLMGGNQISVGGELGGSKEGPGEEKRGGVLSGAKTMSVETDSLLMIPAKIPHQNSFISRTAFLIVKVPVAQENQSPVGSVLDRWDETVHIDGYMSGQ